MNWWHPMLTGTVLLLAASAPAPCIAAEPLARLQVDFAQHSGHLRALHGVNLGPLCYRGTVDLTAYHRELKIPLTRLHDVCWVNAEAVDIHTVFPDFRADPAIPSNYQFGPTDDYLRAITNVPSAIVYRLGESIEHTAHKYFVHPPPDPEKWAAICRGIIRHENAGWADGLRLGIRYWEIWNEPDVRPSMWTGTDDNYFHLYEVTAKAIESEFPDVKVGGPALGGSGSWEGTFFRPSPFFTNFLAYCREHRAPLDFFSWHCYTSDPWEPARRARAVRQVLDENGFKATESHLNEWNYLPNDDWRPLTAGGQGIPRQRWFAQMSGPAGAAFAATALMLLEDAPINAANYYTGDVQGFGLFTFEGVPKLPFYAFKAFAELLNTPERVPLMLTQTNSLVAIAGLDSAHRRGTILISNFRGPEIEVTLDLQNMPWPGSTLFKVQQVDATHALTPVQESQLTRESRELRIKIPGPGIVLVRMQPAGRAR